MSGSARGTGAWRAWASPWAPGRLVVCIPACDRSVPSLNTDRSRCTAMRHNGAVPGTCILSANQLVAQS
ncbi:hypothetical protein JB92DRAFT_2985332 [Gautieria morchelliformis]|nr:hypothetical protein JB92DRAFT_2985332 [Gautieria morchelliformis]